MLLGYAVSHEKKDVKKHNTKPSSIHLNVNMQQIFWIYITHFLAVQEW